MYRGGVAVVDHAPLEHVIGLGAAPGSLVLEKVLVARHERLSEQHRTADAHRAGLLCPGRGARGSERGSSAGRARARWGQRRDRRRAGGGARCFGRRALPLLLGHLRSLALALDAVERAHVRLLEEVAHVASIREALDATAARDAFRCHLRHVRLEAAASHERNEEGARVRCIQQEASTITQWRGTRMRGPRAFWVHVGSGRPHRQLLSCAILTQISMSSGCLKSSRIRSLKRLFMPGLKA